MSTKACIPHAKVFQETFLATLALSAVLVADVFLDFINLSVPLNMLACFLISLNTSWLSFITEDYWSCYASRPKTETRGWPFIMLSELLLFLGSSSFAIAVGYLILFLFGGESLEMTNLIKAFGLEGAALGFLLLKGWVTYGLFRYNRSMA